MKIYIYILLVILCESINEIHCTHGKTSIVSVKEGIHPGGVWQSQTEWKAYWVKEWITKKVYVPLWKKVWGPVEVRKWIPTGHPPHGQERL